MTDARISFQCGLCSEASSGDRFRVGTFYQTVPTMSGRPAQGEAPWLYALNNQPVPHVIDLGPVALADCVQGVRMASGERVIPQFDASTNIGRQGYFQHGLPDP